MNKNLKITKTNDVLNRFVQNYKELSIQKIVVGVPGNATSNDGKESLATIAASHEFGLPERGIPRRSFLIDPIRNNMDKYVAKLRLIYKNLHRVTVVEQALSTVGNLARTDVIKVFGSDSLAPNSPITIAAKGSSKPLIDTGALRQSIFYEVRKQ